MGQRLADTKVPLAPTQLGLGFSPTANTWPLCILHSGMNVLYPQKNERGSSLSWQVVAQTLNPGPQEALLASQGPF